MKFEKFNRDHNELAMHLGHGHFLLSHEDAIHRLNAAHNVYAISNAEIFSGTWATVRGYLNAPGIAQAIIESAPRGTPRGYTFLHR